MAEAPPQELARLLNAPDPPTREAAWDAFVAAHSRLLLHTARLLNQDYDDAMDSYAYILEALREDGHRRLRAYSADGRGRFSTWLVVVARRLCFDFRRHKYGRARDPSLADTTRVRLASAPGDETTLGALGYVAGERRDTLGLTQVHYLLTIPVGSAELRQAGLNLAFCLAPDGKGSPFRFATDLAPGSDSLVISRTSQTHWVVETQPYPNNKGWCEHHNSDGSVVALLIHVDLKFEIDNLNP